ncbi:MAG: phage holin family protein [Anaerolineales bacterium]
MVNRKPSLINRPVVRILIIWVIQTLALIILTFLLAGLDVDRIGTAMLAVVLIGFINAIFWPLLSYILLPFVVLTMGILSWVINGIVIWLAGQFINGFEVADLGTAMLTALGLTIINLIASSLLTIDDDGFWYRNIVQRRMKRRESFTETDVPGVLFLEIDGLSRPVLELAIQEGYVPNLAKWLQTGTHKLIEWETDLSSQTSASQAGILLGNNTNIPAFRWFDRGKKEIVASSSPNFVAELEKKLSNGDGLLAEGGASRGNLFSGDAPNVMNTASTVTDLSRFHTSEFYAYFLHPYNFIRTVVLTIWDIILEMRQFRKARQNDVYPILEKSHRGGKYPILRAFMTVIMLDLNIYTLIGDIFSGAPSVYATFVGYDEVAHHSGVESKDALDILQKIDRQFSRVENALEQAPRPYFLVVLSDHGQTNGATFKQRYNMTLEQFVQQLATDKYNVQGAIDVHEDWKQLNVFLSEAIAFDHSVVSRPLGRALKDQTSDGEVILGPEGDERDPDNMQPEQFAHLVALASGNLGLIYSTRLGERSPMEVIEKIYPGMLDGLASHDGIGFIMVHSEEHGPVAIGANGKYYINEDRVEGENPLVRFGPNVVAHLKRTDSFPDAPDILVNSFYDPDKKEGAAFEELIGFHGGLGGYQTQPFLMYPAEWDLKVEEIVGAEQVYKVLKGKLVEMQKE